ncbi:DNA mismatch repair protein Msh2 [Nymphon striatum]|nr:DNA mismatch repair protein Msh2 [Nymphon striatum]
MAGNSDNASIAPDGPQQQSFIAFYSNLPKKPATTLRVFDRNEYYTVHGQDALFCAKEIYKTTSVLKYFGSGKYLKLENLYQSMIEAETLEDLYNRLQLVLCRCREKNIKLNLDKLEVGQSINFAKHNKSDKKLEYVTLSQLKFEAIIRELLQVRQYRVELYENQSTGKNQNWILKHEGSPGNMTEFEDLLFGNSDMSSNAGVMSIKLSSENGQQVVGIAYTDASERKFVVAEFIDNELFTNLEVLIVQLGPKECLIQPINSSPDVGKLSKMLERTKALVTERKKGEFNDKDIVADLNRLVKFKKGEQVNSSVLPEMDMSHAMCALAVLIKYFDLLGEECYFGQYKLTTFNLQQYIRLDNSVMKALNLFPTCQEGNFINYIKLYIDFVQMKIFFSAADKMHSIYGLLNKCRTAQGQRLLGQWLKQPLIDINKIGMHSLFS